MESLPETINKSRFSTKTSSANSSVALTAAARTLHYNVVYWVMVSFDRAPTNVPNVTITIGGSTVFKTFLPKTTDPIPIFFPGGLYRDKNEAVVVTLSAGGGASDVGILNVKSDEAMT